jgi:hypothetical protein
MVTRINLTCPGVLLAVLVTVGPCQAGGDPIEVPSVFDLPDASGEVSGMWNVNDAGGHRWDIHLNYGYVHRGQNNTFSNGMYLHVNGSNYYNGSGKARLSPDGKEVLLAPWNRNGVVVARRVRIDPETRLTRWLDVFQNSTDQPQTVDVRLQTHVNYGIGGVSTSSGDDDLDDSDVALVVLPQNNPAQALRTLHVAAGPNARARPKITLHGNRIQYDLRFALQPGQTAVLALFLAQEKDPGPLKKQMTSLRVSGLFRDLPKELRKLIVNFRATGEGLEVYLERLAGVDRVQPVGRKPIFGTIANGAFTLRTPRGPIELPAAQVIGFQADPNRPGWVRTLLADGQLLIGWTDDRIELDVPAAGRQAIPLADVDQASFRISDEKPEEVPFQGPYLVYRDGSRRALVGRGLPLRLLSRHGPVELHPDDLLRIDLDSDDHPAHRVVFRNGSVLSGLLEPATLTVRLRLDERDRTVRLADLRALQFARHDAPPQIETLVLDNGDRLLGRLRTGTLRLESDFGPADIATDNLRSLVARDGGRFEVTLWNRSALTGRCGQDRLRFQIEPGPEVAVWTAQVVSLSRPAALPPNRIRRVAEKLIAQLAAESYADRQAAQKQLLRMGPGIVPILKKHADATDPEVRRRIEELLAELAQSSQADPSTPPVRRIGPPPAARAVAVPGRPK